MDVFQLCQHVGTIESTIEFLFETDMLSPSFNCHLCGTECTLVEEEEDEEVEAPRSPNGNKGHTTPTKKKSTPKSSTPKKSPRAGSPKTSAIVENNSGIGNTMRSPTRRQYSAEEEEASVRSIAYASVLGGAAAAASLAAAKNAHNELVSNKGTPKQSSSLELSISTSRVVERNDSGEDDDDDGEEGEEEEDDDDEEDDEEEEETQELMKVSDTDKFWWCCPNCGECACLMCIVRSTLLLLLFKLIFFFSDCLLQTKHFPYEQTACSKLQNCHCSVL
jgi:hypothetical protein